MKAKLLIKNPEMIKTQRRKREREREKISKNDKNPVKVSGAEKINTTQKETEDIGTQSMHENIASKEILTGSGQRRSTEGECDVAECPVKDDLQEVLAIVVEYLVNYDQVEVMVIVAGDLLNDDLLEVMVMVAPDLVIDNQLEVMVVGDLIRAYIRERNTFLMKKNRYRAWQKSSIHRRNGLTTIKLL